MTVVEPWAHHSGFRATGVGAFLLVLALVGVGLGLSGPTAAAQAPTYDANGVRATDISLNVTGSTLQAGYTVDVSSERNFPDLVLSVRDARSNYDFIHRQNVTVEPGTPRTFSDSRSLPDGSYKAFVSYRDSNGNWVNLEPVKTFTVGPVPTPPPGGPWTLAFSDEFNDGTLNAEKWSAKYDRPGDAGHTNPSNGEAQWYKWKNVRESDNTLNLTARRERTVSPYSGVTYNYSSGMVTSRPSLNFAYGYVEARVKLPKGSGFWPAFWTWPSNPRFATPEIDIMEFWGDNPSLLYLIFHRQLAATDTRKIGTETKVRHPQNDWTRSWHRVAADWEPGRIRWYVDGVLRKTETTTTTRAAYLIANLAVSNGRMGPKPNASTPFPSTYRIDYIRVWKR
jgi:hypothetical protein